MSFRVQTVFLGLEQMWNQNNRFWQAGTTVLFFPNFLPFLSRKKPKLRRKMVFQMMKAGWKWQGKGEGLASHGQKQPTCVCWRRRSARGHARSCSTSMLGSIVRQRENVRNFTFLLSVQWDWKGLLTRGMLIDFVACSCFHVSQKLVRNLSSNWAGRTACFSVL